MTKSSRVVSKQLTLQGLGLICILKSRESQHILHGGHTRVEAGMFWMPSPEMHRKEPRVCGGCPASVCIFTAPGWMQQQTTMSFPLHCRPQTCPPVPSECRSEVVAQVRALAISNNPHRKKPARTPPPPSTGQGLRLQRELQQPKNAPTVSWILQGLPLHQL